MHYRWRFNATFRYAKNKLNEEKKTKRNEKEGNTGTPTSFVCQALSIAIILLLHHKHACTHAQNTIRFYNNNRQRCLFLSFIRITGAATKQLRESESNQVNRQVLWHFYDFIILFTLFWAFHFDTLREMYHVRIGFVPCEFPLRIYGLNHTNKAEQAVCYVMLGVLCWCVHTYRQLFCHCVWWLPCYFGLFKAHIQYRSFFLFRFSVSFHFFW